eukprot:1183919-Prorocentrum_minimum.AAC.4
MSDWGLIVPKSGRSEGEQQQFISQRRHGERLRVKGDDAEMMGHFVGCRRVEDKLKLVCRRRALVPPPPPKSRFLRGNLIIRLFKARKGSYSHPTTLRGVTADGAGAAEAKYGARRARSGRTGRAHGRHQPHAGGWCDHIRKLTNQPTNPSLACGMPTKIPLYSYKTPLVVVMVVHVAWCVASPGVDDQKGLRLQFNSRQSSTVDTNCHWLADSRLRGLVCGPVRTGGHAASANNHGVGLGTDNLLALCSCRALSGRESDSPVVTRQLVRVIVAIADSAHL